VAKRLARRGDRALDLGLRSAEKFRKLLIADT
jgi:hypothetical protein